jgi:hypothetical protein
MIILLYKYRFHSLCEKTLALQPKQTSVNHVFEIAMYFMQQMLLPIKFYPA